jgi:hypothetical protein
MDHGRELTSALRAAGRQAKAARRVAGDAGSFTLRLGALFRGGQAVGPPPAPAGNLIL